VPFGDVIRTDPPAGRSVEKGTSVYMIISTGSGRR
jgi:beta-lactam-binding protein with PASTA domain